MIKLTNMSQNERWKLIFLLSGILGFMTVSGLFEHYKLGQIQEGFSSIYSDRLIPATEIYFISENLHDKHKLLDGYFRGQGLSEAELGEMLAAKDEAVTDLVRAYEKTYLVKAESHYLAFLKEDLQTYAGLQKQVLKQLNEGSLVQAKRIFEEENRVVFEEIVANLNQLAQIQSSVGKELVLRSNSDFASTNLLFYLRLVLSLVIGTLIMALIKNARLVKLPNQKFNLN